MKQWKLLGTTACVALMAGSAALAEVTPQEVWENWKALSTSYGQTMTVANEEDDGETLTATGIVITSEEGGAKATITIDEAVITDAGDGSAVLTMSDIIKMEMVSPASTDVPAVTTKVSIAAPGMETTVSGTAEEMTYALSGDSMTIKLDGVEGEEVPSDLKVEAVLAGLEGSYIVGGSAEEKTVGSAFAASSLAVTFGGTNPEDGSKVAGTVNMANLEGTSASTMIGDMTKLAEALKAGTAMEGSFAYESASFDFNVTDASGDTKATGTNAGGSFNFAMDADALSYGATGKDASFTLSGGQIPFPQVNVAYKESAFDLLMPVSKSEAPADFKLMMKLGDLTISDDIWNMIDPGKQLPRDPMTVHLDTAGKAKLTTDLMDETAMANAQAAPGELHALDIKALQVKLAGADVTGTGALTFDNSDLTTFAGVPAPTGSINLKAVGVNGLLDKLMAMGLVPEDQMMGARMMLGMFAKVVDGQPDTLTSNVEFKNKGLFVNGMQLQ